MQSTYPLATSADEIIPAILRERQTRAFEDAQRVHGAERPDSPRIQRSRAVGLRSWVGVPLLRDGNAVGALAVARQDVKPFSDKEISLLETFADQAVIAIENVRLFRELQEKNRALTTAHARVSEALEQQTAMSEILRVISQSPTDVQPVFNAIAESAARLTSAVLGAAFLVVDDMLHLVGTHVPGSEPNDAFMRAYPIPLDDRTLTTRVARERIV